MSVVQFAGLMEMGAFVYLVAEDRQSSELMPDMRSPLFDLAFFRFALRLPLHGC